MTDALLKFIAKRKQQMLEDELMALKHEVELERMKLRAENVEMKKELQGLNSKTLTKVPAGAKVRRAAA